MSDYYPPAAIVTADMQVIDAAGALVGQVKELRGPCVLVDRRLKRDLYVPLEAIVARDGETLTLNVTVDQIDELGWSKPPLLGGPDPASPTASDHQLVNRDELAVGGPTERATPLDTRAGQLTTSGTDDGALPPVEDVLGAEQQRLRDLSG
jgi:hypothetical protein